MKYSCFLVFICLLAINNGCIHHEHKDVELASWSTLTIESEESTEVNINNYDDTSTVIVYHVGSFFSPRPKKSQKIKIDTTKIYFTPAQKDTIFNLSKDIISNPIKLKGGCTEYVGDLKVVIDYGVFKERAPGSLQQSIEYSGVCNWNTLSVNTIKLHGILKRKMKNIYLGEHDPI
ncbi:hypothetical protein [Mucilaginibacter sp.]|uniref:hypothetical protein n=1 Tax=Mucilaginibacter sp. TaxID=1882438 RepID=UPI00284014B0|nr:hypothetical protein [Mucilaginibacter sp.]MDR3696506.1 hypothetical protein [Mucilaginibacter sp.]